MSAVNDFFIINKTYGKHSIRIECRQLDGGSWFVKTSINNDAEQFYTNFPDISKEALYAIFAGDVSSYMNIKNKIAEIYVPDNMIPHTIVTTMEKDTCEGLFENHSNNNDSSHDACVDNEEPFDFMTPSFGDEIESTTEVEHEQAEANDIYEPYISLPDAIRLRCFVEPEKDENVFDFYERMKNRMLAVGIPNTASFSSSDLIHDKLTDARVIYEIICVGANVFTEKTFSKCVREHCGEYACKGDLHEQKRFEWYKKYGFIENAGFDTYAPTLKFKEVFTKPREDEN